MDKNKINSDREILLAYDKKNGRVQAVAGMDGTGNKIKTLVPSLRNEQRFITVEKNSKELESFFKDFMTRSKNPDDIVFYRSDLNGLKKGAEILAGLSKYAPESPALAHYRVNPQVYLGQSQEQASKVLLTPGEDGKLKAVAGMEKDGRLNTVEPTKENSDKFFQINPNGNLLDNFMQKFSSQYEHPSHTGLYAVTAGAVDKIAAFLDKIIQVNPDDKVLEPYKVKPDGEMQQSQEQGKYQPLDLNKVDWKDAEKLGLTGEGLQDTLKAMSYGHKSPGLVDIKTELDGKEVSVKARLSLEQQPDGSIKIQAHPFQEKPDFGNPFMGVQFTDKDIEQFKQTGNGGRVFDLEPVAGGGKVPSLISLDRLTNRFEAMPLSEINISATLKNAPLSEDQQAALKRGEGVLITGMDKRLKAGEEPSKIDRVVQYNAANRNFDFRFTPEQQEKHRQERAARQQQGADDKPLKTRKVDGIFIRPVQGGVELTREQFNKLCNKEPVWLEGLQKPKPKQQEGAKQVEATDKKGQKYNAWVWPDPEKGHVRHTSKHPDEIKAKAGQKVTPAEGHKTQVAVNNEGKTNEATKHAQNKGEALKPGQTNPTAKQTERKAEKEQKHISPPKPGQNKSKGRKM